MNKKILSAILIISPFSTSFAVTPGFYAGAAIEAHDYHSKLTHIDTEDDSNNKAEFKIGNTNVSGMILGGYTFASQQNWGMSFQIDLEGTGGSTSQISSNGLDDGDIERLQFKEKNNYDFGIGLLPRIQLNDSNQAFLKLAYRRGHFKSTINNFEQDGDTGTISTSNINKSNWRNGFEYGVGLQSALTNQWDIFLAATQTQYQSRTISPAPEQFTSKVYVNRAKLGIIWHPAPVAQSYK